MAPESGGESFRDLPQRDAAGVGGDDRVGLAQRLHFFKKRALDLQVFDHGFQNPVAISDAARSLSKFPGETSDVRESRKNPPGRCLAAFSTPFFASSVDTSSSREGMPALAKCAAIREPIVPAPRTATR